MKIPCSGYVVQIIRVPLIEWNLSHYRLRWLRCSRPKNKVVTFVKFQKRKFWQFTDHCQDDFQQECKQRMVQFYRVILILHTLLGGWWSSCQRIRFNYSAIVILGETKKILRFLLLVAKILPIRWQDPDSRVLRNIETSSYRLNVRKGWILTKLRPTFIYLRYIQLWHF